MGGLHNKPLFLMVLESGRSKIKVSVDLMSGENPLRDLHTHLLAGSSCSRDKDVFDLFLFL